MATRSVSSSRFLVARTAQKSLSFNGSSDYATVPITPDTIGFSIGFWCNFGIQGATNRRSISWQGTNTGLVLIVAPFSVNEVRMNFQIFDGGAASVNKSTNAGQIVINSWSHHVFTFAPNNFSWYINGTLFTTDTLCSMATAVGKTLTLGRNNDASNAHSNVKYKNFTFQNTAIPWTQAQVDALCFRNVIPTGAKQYSMNDAATDQDGANALTLTGTSYSTDVPGHMAVRSAATNRFLLPTSAQKSMNFNGTSDSATVPITPLITGFSLAGWFFFPSFVSGVAVISWSSNASTDGFFLVEQGTVGQMYFRVNDRFIDLPTTTMGKKGIWRHICFTHIQGAQKLYLDNSLVDSDTGTMSTVGTQTLNIGKASRGNLEWSKCNIKNFTFQNTTTAWTTTQIADLYYRNVIPSSAKQYSMNDVATDQDGANALTLTGTSYVTNVPLQNRSTV